MDEPIAVNVRHRFAPKHIGRLIAGFAWCWHFVWSFGGLLVILYGSRQPCTGALGNNTFAALAIVAIGAIGSATIFAWLLHHDQSKGHSTRMTIQNDRLTFESGGSIARDSVLSGAIADLDAQQSSVAVQTKTERWLITVPKRATRDIEAALGLKPHNAAAHFSAYENSSASNVVLALLVLMPGFAMLGAAAWSIVCAITFFTFGENFVALQSVLVVLLVVALPTVLTARIIQGKELRISARSTNLGAMSVGVSSEGPPSDHSEAQSQNIIESSLRLSGLRTSGLTRHALVHLIAARNRAVDHDIVNGLNDLLHGDRSESKPYRTRDVDVRSIALDATSSVEARALASRILIEHDPKDPTAASALALLPLRQRQRRAILFGSRDRALKVLRQLRNWDPATLAA